MAYVLRLLLSVEGMKVRLMKAFATACLAFLLVSSGAAWALQHCLLDSHPGDHVHASDSEAVNARSSLAYPAVASRIEHRHGPLSRIHCRDTPILKLSFGPCVFDFSPGAT